MTAINAEVLTVEGAPQAGVTVTGLEAGNQVISVQVSWDGGATFKDVSGGRRIVAVGGAFVRDYFPPLNVPATYRVVEHSISGAPTSDTLPLTIASARSWLQDPLNPREAVSVVSDGHTPDGNRGLMAGSFASAAWSQQVDFAQVLGADRPVASAGQRMIAGQVPLVIQHEVAAEGGKLRRLLMQAGQLVLRGHDFDLLEAVAHFVVPDASERRELRFTNPPHQVSTWDLTATQVRPLSLKIVVPYWTYAQVAALWSGSTYQDAYDARPGDTYLSWLRDPVVP